MFLKACWRSIDIDSDRLNKFRIFLVVQSVL